MTSPTFAARFNAIAADKHPFRVTVRLRREMVENPAVGATTEPDTVTTGSGTSLIKVSIYVRPGMPRSLVIEDLAHEIGGHAYGDITNPARELDDSGPYDSQPREKNAYAIGARIMAELNSASKESAPSSSLGQELGEGSSQMRKALQW